MAHPQGFHSRNYPKLLFCKHIGTGTIKIVIRKCTCRENPSSRFITARKNLGYYYLLLYSNKIQDVSEALKVST